MSGSRGSGLPFRPPPPSRRRPRTRGSGRYRARKALGTCAQQSPYLKRRPDAAKLAPSCSVRAREEHDAEASLVAHHASVGLGGVLERHRLDPPPSRESAAATSSASLST